MKIKNSKLKNGFTLVDALVGAALLAIVFSGIFGAYRLGMKVIGLGKNKITATAIANAKIELIRALPYGSVGVKNAVLPDAIGVLDSVEQKNSNGIYYTVTTAIKYVADPADGIGAADLCNLDYKNARITVSWGGSYGGNLTISTNIMPQSLAQEAQSCQSQPGGILTVTAFDSSGALVSSPLISVNSVANPAVGDSATPSSGKYSFALPVGVYRINVSKSGYGTARTYAVGEIVNGVALASPNDPDLMVFNGGVAAKSILIDRVAAISVDGISQNGQNNFADSFVDQTKISSLNSTQVVGGSVTLVGPPYETNGSVVSAEIFPDDLVAWNEFSFSNIRPATTNITYQILYFNGSDWLLIPDQYIGGNSLGLTNSPIQLSSVLAANYSKLKIKANLLSNDQSVTPQIKSWQISWVSKIGTAIGNGKFHIDGQKTIGKTTSGSNVYKYSQNLALDASGHLDLPEIESDSYSFLKDTTSEFELIGIDPSIQPINAPFGSVLAVKLHLETQNSFFLTIQDQDTLRPVNSAIVQLVNSSFGYNTTQYTNALGQTYFAPLKIGNYSLSIVVPGYESQTTTIAISAKTTKFISIKQNE